MADIKFGTDGWRAVVGKDFNEENVGIVSKAIGKYVFDTYGIYKTIMIIAIAVFITFMITSISLYTYFRL